MQAAAAQGSVARAPAAGAAGRRHIVVQCTHSDVSKPQVQRPQQQRQEQAAGSRRAVLGLGAALLAAQIAPARAEEPVSIAEQTEVGWGRAPLPLPPPTLHASHPRRVSFSVGL